MSTRFHWPRLAGGLVQSGYGKKIQVVPLGITKEGSWLLGAEPSQLIATQQTAEEESVAQTTAVTLTGDPSLRRLVATQSGPDLGSQGVLDVIFPILHGTYGEDGSLQGLLDMANIPYVGCGVLGAALGMDKEKMKMIFQAARLLNCGLSGLPA